MKSDIISIKNEIEEIDIENILAQVDKVAQYQRLDAKQTSDLRLIAEELIGFEKGILGFSEGQFYIENQDNEYKVCLHADVKTDIWTREKAGNLSSSQQNAAYTGFKGKLRKIMDTMCELDGLNADVSEMSGFVMNPGNAYSASGYNQAWSMNAYKGEVKKNTEEWDMLEHSILANVADDVIVASRNDFIDIIVVKKF